MRHWQGRRCCFLAYCRGRSHRGAASVAAAVSCPRPLLSMGQLGADAADRSRADGWQAVVAPSTPTGLWHALMGGAQHGFFCPAAAVAVAFTATESAAAASAAAAMAAATTAAAVAPTAATVGWSTDVAATCCLRPRPFYFFFCSHCAAVMSPAPPCGNGTRTGAERVCAPAAARGATLLYRSRCATRRTRRAAGVCRCGAIPSRRGYLDPAPRGGSCVAGDATAA